MKKQSLLTFSLLSVAAMQAADKPNVILIYTDEHNFKTIEAYLPLMQEAQRHPWGDNLKLETPNLNFLAENGVLMNNCHVTTPVSTPSRSSMMSGLYPQKNNCIINDVAMNPELKTMPQCFVENGYETGYVGKWHLSGGAKPGWAPTPNYGWQNNVYMFNRGHYKSITEQHGGAHPEVLDGLTDDINYNFMTDFLTDKAIDFVTKERTAPFFCCLSIPDPHGPNIVSHKYQNLYTGYVFQRPKTALKDMSKYPSWAVGKADISQGGMQNYWGMVKCVDDNIGRLIDALREKGILDNTIIIFTSDHGDLCGEHALHNKNRPMESSLKVPFIIYAPKMLPKGRVVQPAVSNLDVYPTLASLCGLTGMPDNLDGTDISPLLKGDESYQPLNCVFSRQTGDYTGWLSVTTDRYKMVVSSEQGDEPWLFDREVDPDELVNFYYDDRYQSVVADLTKRLVDYCEKNAEPKYKNNKIRQNLGQAPLEDDQNRGDNMLINGDFEKTESIDGVARPLNWEITASEPKAAEVVPNGLEESNCLKMGVARKTVVASARQTVAVVPGETYVLTGYCYYAGVPSEGKKATIKILDSEDRVLKEYQIPTTGTTGKRPDDTHIRSIEFTATMEMASILIENNGIDKLIRFDNFQVSKKQLTAIGEVVDEARHDNVSVQEDELVFGYNVRTATVYSISGSQLGASVNGATTVGLNNYPEGVLVVKAELKNGKTEVKKILN